MPPLSCAHGLRDWGIARARPRALIHVRRAEHLRAPFALVGASAHLPAYNARVRSGTHSGHRRCAIHPLDEAERWNLRKQMSKICVDKPVTKTEINSQSTSCGEVLVSTFINVIISRNRA